MLTFQGVYRLVGQIIRAAKRALPRNAASINAFRHSQEQNNLAINAMRREIEVMWNNQEKAPLSSDDYFFKLGRLRSLYAAQLEVVSKLHSLGAATKQDVALCRSNITNLESYHQNRSLYNQDQRNQKLYRDMEDRLELYSADDPAESTEQLFTLNRMSSLQAVRLERLQALKAPIEALTECNVRINRIEQQKKALAAQQHQLAIRQVTPQEASVPLAEAA